MFKEESLLTVVIAKLWNEHKTVKSIVSQNRKSAKWLRLDLQRQLHAYKKLLVGAGRDGQWAQFLRHADIPLSTADHYVKNCERELILLHSPPIEPSSEHHLNRSRLSSRSWCLSCGRSFGRMLVPTCFSMH